MLRTLSLLHIHNKVFKKYQTAYLSPSKELKEELNMNASMIKIMVVSRAPKQCSLLVGQVSLQRVQKYLGSWVNDSCESDTEIRIPIETARASFMSMSKVITTKTLSIELCTRLLQCYIWPVILYGCECWTMKEDLRKTLETFEIWAYRFMLRIN